MLHFGSKSHRNIDKIPSLAGLGRYCGHCYGIPTLLIQVLGPSTQRKRLCNSIIISTITFLITSLSIIIGIFWKILLAFRASIVQVCYTDLKIMLYPLSTLDRKIFTSLEQFRKVCLEPIYHAGFMSSELLFYSRDWPCQASLESTCPCLCTTEVAFICEYGYGIRGMTFPI